MKRLVILLPVLFGFFVMGFCDVVGISTNFVQIDFNLSETVAGLIPSMVFLWFLLLSVPSALMMNRIGRKRTVLLSNIVTFAGMILPLIQYNLATCMVAFLLLGIGNTMLQVSLNPLLTNIVKGNALTSFLTAGQVVKAISSFSGPLIAARAAIYLGNWKFMFPIFAAITLLSTMWLYFTPIDEEPTESNSNQVMSTFSLLGQSEICFLFFGIFFIVGVDVGINTLAPKLIISRCGLPLHQAAISSSVYFVCRTAGAMIGSFLLARVSGITYFRYNIIGALFVTLTLFFLNNIAGILVAIGLLGFLCSSIFTIIYARALSICPDKENEISGLMIMGIVGGAIIPPVMGLATDVMNSLSGSIIVLIGCIVYLSYLSMRKEELTH
ncbi:MAG: MFS transporter [Muribaculaceae bacterium]|nr:MFS transporter [Muribaculaceae bacterium]